MFLFTLFNILTKFNYLKIDLIKIFIDLIKKTNLEWNRILKGWRSFCRNSIEQWSQKVACKINSYFNKYSLNY